MQTHTHTHAALQVLASGVIDWFTLSAQRLQCGHTFEHHESTTVWTHSTTLQLSYSSLLTRVWRLFIFYPCTQCLPCGWPNSLKNIKKVAKNELLRHPIRADPFDVFFLFLTLQSALIICKLNSVTGHMTRTDNDQWTACLCVTPNTVNAYTWD